MQLPFKAKSTAQLHRIKRKSLIGQAVIVLLGLELLFFSSFTAFELPTATKRNLGSFFSQKMQYIVSQLPERLQKRVYRIYPELDNTADTSVRYTLYAPQAAVAVFIGYALGWPLATIAAGLFFLIGLVAPFFNLHPFAEGGGFDYYLQPGFGYLIGMVLATAAIGFITKDKRTTLSQVLGVLAALAVMHLVGLAYLLGICLFFSIFEDLQGFPFWSQWVFEQARNLSWYTLPYDLAFGLALVGVGHPFRWLVNILVAPDIAFKGQNQPERGLTAVGSLRG